MFSTLDPKSKHCGSQCTAENSGMLKEFSEIIPQKRTLMLFILHLKKISVIGKFMKNEKYHSDLRNSKEGYLALIKCYYTYIHTHIYIYIYTHMYMSEHKH
jgi:hypothetical protein